MSVVTFLYLSSSWCLEDIITVIKKHLGYKVEIKCCVETSPRMFDFYLTKDGHSNIYMTVFVNGWSPLGPTTQLRLGANDEGKQIMKDIAEVLGGLIHWEDCDDNYELIDGLFNPEDGLPYFLKYAIINNEMVNVSDLKGLNKSIIKWEKRVGPTQSRIDTFEED